ncbi:MAG: hypothetical protein ABI587_16160 [Gemmatimonadales bacterium]
MGSFFVTDDPAALDGARAHFAAKGLDRHTSWTVGATHVLVFDKRFVPSGQHEARIDDDAILGVGAYTYEDASGPEALRRILAACRCGETPFAQVHGHWLLIVRIGGRLSVVTDKTGVYHAHVGRTDRHAYLSNSLFAIADALGRLTVSLQECLEFLFTQCTFGQRTIFEEIRHLDPGTIHAGDGLHPSTVYYRPLDDAVDLAGYFRACTAYFAPYHDPASRINCDLSGGYDTRTVAALLVQAGVPLSFNTNINADDPDDHRIAIELAAAVGAGIELFEPPAGGDSPDAMVDRTFTELELCRDIYRSSLTPYYFEAKARRFGVIFGGYGGELLRDKYSRFRSVREMVEAAYLTPGIRGADRARTAYVDRLVAKFEARLQQLDERDIRKGVEKIYYLEKMKYWGGSRITAFNQYCHHVHPLLDDTLARHAFAFTLQEKQDGALQRRMITAASRALAEVRSGYSNRSMLYPDPSPGFSAQKLASRLRQVVRNARTTVTNARALRFLRPGQTRAAALPSSAPRFEAQTGIKLSQVYNSKIAGRVLTLERALARFGDRIGG